MNSAPRYPLDPEPQTPKKKNHRGWRIFGGSILGLCCFLMALLVALGAMIDADGLHQALLKFADRKAAAALGVNVHIQNFVLHWSSLSLDVYGVKIAGAGAHPGPPLLQLRHAEAGVRVVSIFKREWYLRSLRIDDPVVWIYIDKNGHSNLPALKSGKSSNNNMLFTLAIRHATLEGGRIYYNSVPKAIDADLRNLNLRAAYTPARRMYSGEMAYSNGRLKYGAYRPIPHDMSLAFRLTPAALMLDRARLAVGDSTVMLRAAVNRCLRNPAVQADYHLSLDGAQLAQLLGDPSIPNGVVRAAGAIHFDDIPGRPIMQTLTVNGDLSSNRLNLKAGSMSAAVSSLAAHYAVANGNAALEDFHARLLGGGIAAQGVMTHITASDAHANFSANLRNISLAQLKRMAGDRPAAQSVVLAGTLNATVHAAWGKTMNDLAARVDAGIRADVSASHPATSPAGNPTPLQAAASAPPANSAVVPIDSEIHAVYMRANGHLQLANSYLRTAQTALGLNGTVSRNSSLTIRLQANDLAELAAILYAFRAPAPHQAPLELAGTAGFNGTVTGSISAPRLSGRLAAAHLRIDRSAWRSIRAGIDASPDHAALRNAVLVPAAGGRIQVNAQTALSNWKFSRQSLMQARVQAFRIDLADLARLMTAPPPVTGTLNASLQLHGSVAHPEGNGNLSLTKVTAYRQPIQALRVNFSGNGTQAQADLAVLSPAGSVRANVTVQPRQRTFTAEVVSPGIELSKLAAIADRNIAAGGVLQLHASGQGSFSNPELAATARIPTLTVSNQTLSAVNLELNVANHVAHAALNSSALNTSIQARAAVQLAGDYMTDASLNTSVLDLKPLLAIYAPSQARNISGRTQLRAAIHGPAKNLKQLEAQVTIPVLELAYRNSIQLAETAPIQVNYKDGVLDVPPAGIRGTDTSLTFQAQMPTNSQLPMSLRLNGAVDLQLAQLINPDIHSGGRLNLNIDSHGPMAAGKIGGEIDVVDASFAEGSMPVGLEHGNGVLKLTTNRVDIQSFTGVVGGGKVRLQGGVAYRPHLAFDLGMAASGIRMLYPQGLRETVGAIIHLSGTTASSTLAGTVNLADLSFTPGFDLAGFAGNLSGGVALPPAQGGMKQNMRLDLNVRSTNNLDLVSRQLSVNGAANLQVVGTAAQPVILGRVILTGGDVILNGNRFVLSGGAIQFVNPSQTEPVLNLTMTTNIQQYNIVMHFRGPARQIHADYSSNPALPTADIVHLLAFGDTTEAAANNVMPANQQAESLVASQVASQVTSRISKVAGISQLSVSPVLQGGTQEGPPGATVTVRQRVTGNLFVTFSTNVASTQDQVIQGEYRISPKVSFSATRDPNGGFGFDTLIKHSW